MRRDGCFAEPVIGPRFARTRWLAMTITAQRRSQGLYKLKAFATSSFENPALFALDNFAELPPHLGLGLLHPRLERGEIRGVAGARQHVQQILARGLRPKPFADAKPQDLRQILVQPRRRAQHLSG